MLFNAFCFLDLIHQELLQVPGNSIDQMEQYLLQPNNAIQVIHILPQHWATISTIGCKENTIELYDSVFNTILSSTKNTIIKLLKPNDSVTVFIKNVSKQTDSTECGLYAIAYCTSLLNGDDPCGVIYNQREMRSHLENCFESRRLIPFPVVKRRRFSKAHTSFITVAVCPNCKQPDNGSMMVYCEPCMKILTSCVQDVLKMMSNYHDDIS